jgi:two-component system, OmpR family, response regulator VanR
VTVPPTQKTILVVDDEKDVRDVIGAMLARAGYKIMYANNGMDALAVVDRHAVDMIVIDMLMPVLDGLATIRRLKSDIVSARIPILAVTGDPGSMLRDEAVAAGCDTYLIKPIDPVGLISLVRHWVGG